MRLYSGPGSYFQFPNWKYGGYDDHVQGQDVELLLKLAILNEPQVPSKNLAESLFISPSEVSKALRRCADLGLLYLSSGEKRVNRSALMEFLAHGLEYVFRLPRDLPFEGCPRPLPRNRSNRAYWRMASLPRFGRLQQERFEECHLPRFTRVCPKPHCSIQSYMAFSLSAMQFAAEERGNETLRSYFSERRSMPDPNLRLLKDAVRKLAQFLDEIVFVGGVTRGLPAFSWHPQYESMVPA